ncbi:MAG: hypothetical protein CL581_06935 [Alteromonadaceae bacterium]|nr:hypothetical protein [Alteromonadaceae bacterium]MBH85862.1 hypothetical protein [Alteromonadaceae bacterium]|tara:strand:+ start:3292 stop:4413 length:1122 start_codon:yes stop_codon:yes gene_type:complete
MDITKPYLLILPGVISLFLCHFFFFELSVFVVLNSFLVLFLFSTVSYFLMFFLGLNRSVSMAAISELVRKTRKFNVIFILILIFCFLASAFLVLKFSMKFGFLSIFMNASLLQENAISNSLGNFLYFNVFLFPVLFLLTFYKSKWYMFLLVFSFFFLYFTGIKSYIFQSFALLGLLLLSGKRISSLMLYSLLFLSLLFLYFFIYDVFIDLSSDSVRHSMNRFLSYYSGSWGTYHYYLIDGLESPYPGLTVFYPFYKVMFMGQVTLDEYYRFYDVSGFQLNVVPIFQLAYLEGGFLLQLFFVFILSFFYIFIRFLCLKFENNIFFRVCLFFYCSTFIISSFFSNVFQGLPIYISIFVLIFAGFLSQLRIKKRFG